MDATNLYLSLAAQHSLDAQQTKSVQQLAHFSNMLTTLAGSDLSAFKDPKAAFYWNLDAKSSGEMCTADNSGTIPFDSPFDQSLGSPASTRDYHQSPVQDYDFVSTDAPLFPDHGTQQSAHNDNLLSGLPLFGNELAPSQTLLGDSSSMMTLSQTATSMLPTVPVSDFSFDAMASNPLIFDRDQTVEDLINFANPVPATQELTATMEQSYDNNHVSFLNEASDNFVRACTMLKNEKGLDGLQEALRSAGWGINSDLPASIASSAESICSGSPSPSLSATQETSAFSPCSNASVSPMVLPVSTVKHNASLVRKERSSMQLGSRASLTTIGAQRNPTSKRFVCPDCKKWFDRAFNLRTHSLTHIAPDDRDKPYSCPWTQCHKPFSRKYDAERHYRTVHVKRGENATDEEVEAALSGHQFTASPSSSASTISSDVDAANG